jgi:alkylation response protein AidB-like acyl-CoA dehydrogenase
MLRVLASHLQIAKELAARFKTRASAADKCGVLPIEDIKDIKKSGYLKLCIPKKYGGWGAPLKSCCEAQLELAQGSASTALVVAMTLHVMGHARDARIWPEPVLKKLSQEVCRGALINSIASEPRLGSPSRGGLPDTFAVKDGKNLIINGHKTWSSGGQHLRHLLVRLRLEDEAITVWIPANTKGLHWEKTWGHGLSLRASDSHDLFLENVKVPQSNIIERSGSNPANIWFPLLMAATYLGIAIAARDETIHYATERVPTALGKPIATLSSIQRQIGEIDIDLQATKALLLQAAEEWKPKSQTQSFTAKTAAVKYLAIETALRVTDKALRLVGAAGLDSGLSIERHFRDVRAGIMHPPSGDAALEMVGKHALKIS